MAMPKIELRNTTTNAEEALFDVGSGVSTTVPPLAKTSSSFREVKGARQRGMPVARQHTIKSPLPSVGEG